MVSRLHLKENRVLKREVAIMKKLRHRRVIEVRVCACVYVCVCACVCVCVCVFGAVAARHSSAQSRVVRFIRFMLGGGCVWGEGGVGGVCEVCVRVCVCVCV